MSDKPPSAEYTRFLESVEGVRPEHREELDMGALLALSGDERRAAEEVLIERMNDTDDWRVPPAIAALNLKRAIRPMNDRLPKAKGRMRLALARALVELGALESIEETVIAMLAEGDPDEGISALAALGAIKPTEALVKALSRASVHHPGPEVRINAGAHILQMAKVSGDPLVWEYRPLYLQLGEEDEKVRREAFADIGQLTGLPPDFAD